MNTSWCGGGGAQQTHQTPGEFEVRYKSKPGAGPVFKPAGGHRRRPQLCWVITQGRMGEQCLSAGHVWAESVLFWLLWKSHTEEKKNAQKKGGLLLSGQSANCKIGKKKKKNKTFTLSGFNRGAEKKCGDVESYFKQKKRSSSQDLMLAVWIFAALLLFSQTH